MDSKLELRKASANQISESQNNRLECLSTSQLTRYRNQCTATSASQHSQKNECNASKTIPIDPFWSERFYHYCVRFNAKELVSCLFWNRSLSFTSFGKGREASSRCNTITRPQKPPRYEFSARCNNAQADSFFWRVIDRKRNQQKD